MIFEEKDKYRCNLHGVLNQASHAGKCHKVQKKCKKIV